jgi:iron(III) transport system ATP-binding protein
MPDLSVTGVRKHLGGNDILKGVSFEMARGEVIALLGPSGSGKTTLLRAVAGLDHPDTGRITLGDQVLFDSETGQLVPAEKRNLGLVFQSYALWPHRTVYENVAYGLKLRKVAPEEIHERVFSVLGQIGLEGLSERHPHQLSGGQQQRVALARALVYNPRVILLDEPLSNLDTKLREEARAWLREFINRLNIGAVCVTHDQVEAMAIADRVLLLSSGHIEQEGTPETIYGAPDTLFSAEFMGNNNRFPGKITEIRGELAKVEGEGWSLWGLLRTQHGPGDSATAVIRVEKTCIAETAGENTLPARLETAMFLGVQWECLFRVGDLRIRVWANGAPDRNPSHLFFPPGMLWVF